MSIIDVNMEQLRKHYPHIVEKMKGMNDDYSVKVAPSNKTDECTCTVQRGGQQWLIHSKDDPAGQARFFVDSVLSEDIQSPAVVVVLGVGMGYELANIIHKFSGKTSLFIVIENDIQLFRKFIENRALHLTSSGGEKFGIFEHPAIRFVVGEDPNNIYHHLYSLINDMARNLFTSFYFVEHPILIRFNKQYYKRVCSEIKRICFDIRSSYGNDPLDSWSGIDNMLLNMETIIGNPGVGLLKDQFKEKPAVIVATGPSLNNNIHLLPEIKDKAVFFAADASLNTFFNYETPIIPDIVCSLERNLTTCKHFKQISDDKKAFMKQMWLGACPVVKPQVYDEWHGKKMIVFRDFAHFKWLDLDKGILNTGKSVTNMAFQMAVFMGCDPIILVGQDLAFAPDGKTHVKGADHASSGLKGSPLIQQRTSVMGNNGQKLESLETWVGMLKRFELDIANWKGTCINATEGGALIRGTEIMPLRDAINRHMDEVFSPMKTLDSLLVIDKEKIDCDRQKVDTQIIEGRDYIDKSRTAIDRFLVDCEEGFVMYNDGKLDQASRQQLLGYANKVRMEILHDPMCYFAAMHVIQSWCMGVENVLRCLGDYYDGEEKEIAQLLKIFEFFYGLKILYQLIGDGISDNYKNSKTLLNGGENAD